MRNFIIIRKPYLHVFLHPPLVPFEGAVSWKRRALCEHDFELLIETERDNMLTEIKKQYFPARPVPIASSHREEAIGVSHAQIRAATGKLAFGPNPGFSGFPEAINPGTRRDRYQSPCLTERKRLAYHTPKSERLLETVLCLRRQIASFAQHIKGYQMSHHSAVTELRVKRYRHTSKKRRRKTAGFLRPKEAAVFRCRKTAPENGALCAPRRHQKTAPFSGVRRQKTAPENGGIVRTHTFKNTPFSGAGAGKRRIVRVA
ncbi:hypothetical protein Ddc_18225 [Ditylenchus destructor]|nr:hypothetical protein Ddc_18225 [Ditylenchus destructor]